MDGTVVIDKSLSRTKEKSGSEQCEAWLAQASRDLGPRLERATSCPPDRWDDAFGYISTVQVICRLGPNRNLEPESCLEAVGDIVLSVDELRNCLGDWAFKERGLKFHYELASRNFRSLTTFSEKLKEIYACVSGSLRKQNDCLYDLALKFGDRRLCTLDTDPYPEFVDDSAEKKAGQLRKSQPNCLARVH